jgi:hypothetical protein
MRILALRNSSFPVDNFHARNIFVKTRRRLHVGNPKRDAEIFSTPIAINAAVYRQVA